MPNRELHVRHVCGRYPHLPAQPLRSENIEVDVQEIARVYRLQLHDSENPDALVEIVLEVERD